MSDEDAYVVGTAGEELRVRLAPYYDAENPRLSWDTMAHCVVVHANRYGPPDKEDGGPLGHVWRHLTANGELYPLRDAINPFERTVRMLGGRSLLSTPHEGPSCIWYVLPQDWQESWPTVTADELDAVLKGERDVFLAWCEGDVWGWIIEESVRYTRADGQPGEHSHWEEIEDGSCWGFYGWNDAEEQAKQALADEVTRRAAKAAPLAV